MVSRWDISAAARFPTAEDGDRSCLGGLACFAVAGAACALATSGTMLIISRLIQGFGAGACAVIAFAMIQDLFEGDAARAKRSYVTVIFVAVPMLAPALGSVLMNSFGWRSVFDVLAIAGALLLVVTWIGVAESRLLATTAGRRSSHHLANAPLRTDSGSSASRWSTL